MTGNGRTEPIGPDGVHRNLIGGAWIDGVDINQDVNPSDTSDAVGRYALASGEQAREAVAAARAAAPGWAGSSPLLRFEILDAAGNEILRSKERLGDLLAIPLKPRLTRTLSMVYPKEKFRSRLVNSFVEFATAKLKQFAAKQG